MNPVFCIVLVALVLTVTFQLYKRMCTRPKMRPFRRAEGFAYQPMKTSTSLAPYQCLQNSYRPEVITTYGQYPTQECQTACKD